MPAMKSLRSFRLTSLHGHVLQVKANTPINVPDKLYADALAAGMIETDEPVTGGQSSEPATPAPEVVEPEPFDQAAALDGALLRIITRNDEEDFKADGTPKVNRVNAELPVEAERVTATEVVEAFERLQNDIDLAE